MKQLTASQKAMIREYVLNSLSFDIESGSEQDQIKELKNRFESEYWYDSNKKRYQNDKVQGLKNWLQGLPSGVNIDFTYYDIEQRLKDFGVITETTRENTIEKYISEWWDLVAPFYAGLIVNLK
ncbi:addiction module protein [Escherichia coli]|nr:addiction module protein [Escherichia coli]